MKSSLDSGDCSESKRRDNEMPTISVVIPAYNREKTIGRCILSVAAQTLSPLEILVVDDCSSDKTAEVATRCGYKAEVIRLPRRSGAQAARNAGIRASLGEWIAFLDSDDEWIPEKLAKQMQTLKTSGFDPFTVVHSDYWVYDGTKDVKRLVGLPSVFDGMDVYPSLLASSGPLFQGLLTSKIALEHIGLLDEAVPSHQEWDTFIRLAEHCRFIHVREPLFTYYLHYGETISRNKRKDIEGYLYIIEKFQNEITQQCGSGTLNDHYKNVAMRAMLWGFYDEASDLLKKCQSNPLKISLLKLLAALHVNPGFFCDLAAILNRFRR